MEAKAIKASASKRAHPSGPVKAKAATVSPDKLLADTLRLADEKKQMIKRTTLGLYSLKVGESLYGLPFCAVNDSMALKAQKEVLPQSNLYCVGSFCQYDGLLRRESRPRLVLDNKVDNNG